MSYPRFLRRFLCFAFTCTVESVRVPAFGDTERTRPLPLTLYRQPYRTRFTVCKVGDVRLSSG
jgi:hypothetical protein